MNSCNRLLLTCLLAVSLPLSSRALGTESDADSVAAAPDRETICSHIARHCQLDFESLALSSYHEFIDADAVPLKTFEAVARNEINGCIRPQAQYAAGAVVLGLKPRLNADFIRRDGRWHDSVRVYFNEALFRVKLLENCTAALMREELLWGPGFIAAPSCPFYATTGRNNPLAEPGGKDFASFSWYPNENMTASAYALLSRGAYPKNPFDSCFVREYAIKTDYSYERIYVSAAVSISEKNRLFLGINGKISPADAIVLYADCGVNRRNDAFYPALDATSPLGAVFTRKAFEANNWQPELLVGGSYTFSNGSALGMEYYRNGAGYTRQQAGAYFDLIDRAAGVIQRGESDPRYGLAGYNLMMASFNPLGYLRKNYGIVYFTANDLCNRINLTSGVMADMDDRTAQLFGTVTADIIPWMQFIGSVRLTSGYWRAHYGARRGEFSYMSQYSFTGGIRINL